ncbi:MAG: thioredoxin domain-containing protein [Deltaproteobacteria bacterium]|nr:thioredoxin domain-containing protein [Deltaproteobacteria bacterium]
MNRLAQESSPYLLQHKDNPVDWYPWGPEAFAAARAQDKPVFVSIGYAACHWCHVMAHESFEDDDIAALMNELFINVKVDREERPDVDAVYMNAIHVMGEGGGWPLSAFCDGDGKPYYLGTYFPPVDKYGRPGFPSVLKMMAKVYRDQRDKVEQNTEAVLDGLRRIDEHYRRLAAKSDPEALDAGVVVGAGRALTEASDPKNGGLGSKPKFPSSSAHSLLARASRLAFGEPARAAFLLQCEKMAGGGIYDHLGGGFARYSVDERWLVPHFEKMLYDNGQLLEIYADAYAITGETRYLDVIEETVGYLERELSDPAGGLCASQDADSEGEEGKFYVWTPEQIAAVLGPADAIQFNSAYGVTEEGNFEGATVLERVTDRGDRYEEQALADMRSRLLAARAERVAPATDTKVLAAWNGLAIIGLVRAWEATGHQPALDLARRVGTFLAKVMVADEGRRIHRVFKDGVSKLEGTIDDYAFVALAFMRLAEAEWDASWWRRGAALLATIRERFYQVIDDAGVFYMTPADDAGELIYRPESHQDGAIPAGASVALQGYLRLGRVAGDRQALELAEDYIGRRASLAGESPYGAARLLAAADSLLHGAELVVTEGEGSEALLEAARRSFSPGLMLAGPWASNELLTGKAVPGSEAAAYLCRGQTCSPPTSSPAELAEHLTRRPPG